MSKSKKVAVAVKNYLIGLSVNDKLPTDLNQLDIEEIEKIIESFEPTEKERYIEKASQYLCDSHYSGTDLSIEEQVKAIANHNDSSYLIDNVDGVIVWMRIENEFSCDDFLELIGYVED